MFLYSVYQKSSSYLIPTSATTSYHPKAIPILRPISVARPFIRPLSSSFHFRPPVGEEDLASAYKGQHLADLLTGIVHKPFEVIFRLILIMSREML